MVIERMKLVVVAVTLAVRTDPVCSGCADKIKPITLIGLE